jgi:ADP-heptose:LPS heptosyltransferase|tara:strand:+ start:830 stop:1768 length:939 start_codon:yes stop_codon:yes gene_type:complete
MSNILIIKHGSLGDIVQISGVLKDIREKHPNNKIFILTTFPYKKLLEKCPFIDEVLIDRRLPRWNIFYLLKLRKIINKLKFFIVYDLQNSSRSLFYRKYLFNIANWCSTITTLKKGIKKSDFDTFPVLERFKFQLDNSNVKSNFTLKPDFSWACANVDQIVNRFIVKKFIIIFPFSSPQLKHKQWSYYNRLIEIIKKNHTNLDIVMAPGPNEMNERKKINSISITNAERSLNIMELAGVIKKSSFVISNDTGPAHMAAHLGINGVVLFGYHTTARKVSIETDNFKAISVNDLNDLSADEVYLNIKNKLNLIN